MSKFFTIFAYLLLSCSVCHANPPMSVPSPAPTTDCDSTINHMMVCLPFLLSDESNPDEACCSAFETVATTSVGCICETMGSDETMGSNELHFTMDRTKLMMLPSVCGITSPFNECDGN